VKDGRLQWLGGWLGPALAAGALSLALPGLVSAEEVAPSPSPPVKLDRLLELPDSLDYRVERRGGGTQGEWRERFQEAQAELEETRSALAASEAELASLGESSEAWQLAPPGGGTKTPDAPLSYQLKMQIRRQREEVSGAEERLQDLQIEANLASVPEEWRR
jgi:hypothetical protein